MWPVDENVTFKRAYCTISHSQSISNRFIYRLFFAATIDLIDLQDLIPIFYSFIHRSTKYFFMKTYLVAFQLLFNPRSMRIDSFGILIDAQLVQLTLKPFFREESLHKYLQNGCSNRYLKTISEKYDYFSFILFWLLQLLLISIIRHFHAILCT